MKSNEIEFSKTISFILLYFELGVASARWMNAASMDRVKLDKNWKSFTQLYPEGEENLANYILQGKKKRNMFRSHFIANFETTYFRFYLAT